jgi:hypothetical protein
VGYRFSLVLSREITAKESATLQGGGCAGAVFSTDSLPTNADITVTKIDFDDTISPSLAEAIEAALEAVKAVPDLSVPGLTVPAQPAQASGEESSAAIIEEPAAIIEEPAGKPAAKKTSGRKSAAKKAAATEPAGANGYAAANGNGHTTDAEEAVKAEEEAQAATVGAGRQ